MGLMRTSEGLKQKTAQYTANYGPSVLTMMYNGTGSSIAAGKPVAQSFAGSTHLIAEIVAPATAYLDRAAGIVYPDAIAASSWGWVLSWGYCPAASCFGDTDIAAEDSLKMVDGQTYLIKDQAKGTEATYRRRFIALEAYTTASAADKKVFVECIPLNG